MARIVYLLSSNGGLTGGQKMVLRHVETLRDLGFDAVCYIGAKVPTGVQINIPLEIGTPVRADDIVVIPEEAKVALGVRQRSGQRTVVLSQNPYNHAAGGSFEALDAFPRDNFPPFLTVSDGLAAILRRAYPWAQIDVVPCFADERVFLPAGEKQPAVAYTPRKRPLEADAIQGFFRKFHPAHAKLSWVKIADASEAEVAQVMANSSLFLSLSRLESVGMTTLEALASATASARASPGSAVWNTPPPPTASGSLKTTASRPRTPWRARRTWSGPVGLRCSAISKPAARPRAIGPTPGSAASWRRPGCGWLRRRGSVRNR